MASPKNVMFKFIFNETYTNRKNVFTINPVLPMW